MKIFKRIVKEFWIQTILSIAWGFYKVKDVESKEIVPVFIASFSASLFLLSWMFGQVIRIKKQQKIEDEFEHVKSELTELLSKIEKQTKHLVGFSTGGDSIAYFQPSVHIGTYNLQLDLINLSEYPVFDFYGEWIDLDELGIDLSKGKAWTRNRFVVGDIHSSKVALGVLKFDMTNKDKLRINLFCNTRNRVITQQFRVVKVDNKLIIASQTTSNDFKKNNIPTNFPGYDAADPEKIFKQL